MAFKLIESAQTRWRAVNAPHLVPLVRAGATFINGKLVNDRPAMSNKKIDKQPDQRRSTDLSTTPPNKQA